MIFGIVCGVRFVLSFSYVSCVCRSPRLSQLSVSVSVSVCVCVCYLWLLSRISSQQGQEVMNCLE